MIDPAESNERPTPLSSISAASPYAPPSMIDERGVVSDSLPQRLPVALSLVYAIAMAVVTGLIIVLMESSSGSEWLMVLLFSSPLLAVAGFVWLCFAWFDGSGGAARSTLWKIGVTIAVPFASMLLFVPTCLGTGIFVMPMMSSSLSRMAIIIPIFTAYWATCFIVAIRMRSRVGRHAGQILPGPYLAVEPSPDAKTPQ
jgi:hypothetical protein